MHTVQGHGLGILKEKNVIDSGPVRLPPEAVQVLFAAQHNRCVFGDGHRPEIFNKNRIVKPGILQGPCGAACQAGAAFRAFQVINMDTVLISRYGVMVTGCKADITTGAEFAAVLADVPVAGHNLFHLGGIDGGEEPTEIFFAINFGGCLRQVYPGSIKEKDSRGVEHSFLDGMQINGMVRANGYALVTVCTARKIEIKVGGQALFRAYWSTGAAVRTFFQVNRLADGERELIAVPCTDNFKIIGGAQVRVIIFDQQGGNLQDPAITVKKGV